VVAFLLDIIPDTMVGAFVHGELLPVLVVAILFGFALHGTGERGKPVLLLIESLGQVVFGVIGIIMRVAPIGAFGAMAFTIGAFGLGTLSSLGALMACFYGTCLLFIFGVLGIVARVHGFSIWKFVRYIRDELFISLGTSDRCRGRERRRRDHRRFQRKTPARGHRRTTGRRLRRGIRGCHRGARQRAHGEQHVEGTDDHGRRSYHPGMVGQTKISSGAARGPCRRWCGPCGARRGSGGAA
jgi:hypothetical protein